MKPNNFILYGDICYSQTPDKITCMEDGYLICTDGVSKGVFKSIPEQFKNLPIIDHKGKLIIPGLVDLHTHAPQFSYRGLGMDLELLDWLNTHAFPEESKYNHLDYAKKAYSAVVRDLITGPNTRACIFATVHLPATMLLMDMLEESGLVCMVGKVNMDRNSPEILCEESAARSAADTRHWLENTVGRYKNVTPIITPRFIPSCSDELMNELALLQKEFNVPVQSHLSENPIEIDLVKELCPASVSYGDAYDQFGLFGGDAPTIMAHCVWPSESEIELLRKRQVYVAHCPQSNENISSGIAPVRCFIDNDIRVGLGSDVAGGCHTSLFRAMTDAIQMSKLRWRLVDSSKAPLTLEEAFYLGTKGGGGFFGKVGSFEQGYEFDALVIDDQKLEPPFKINIADRLARVIYLSDDRHICGKYIRGCSIIL